jgi:hypothetical protein
MQILQAVADLETNDGNFVSAAAIADRLGATALQLGLSSKLEAMTASGLLEHGKGPNGYGDRLTKAGEAALHSV